MLCRPSLTLACTLPLDSLWACQSPDHRQVHPFVDLTGALKWQTLTYLMNCFCTWISGAHCSCLQPDALAF